MEHAPSRRRTQRIDTRPQVATYGKVCVGGCVRYRGKGITRRRGECAREN